MNPRPHPVLFRVGQSLQELNRVHEAMAHWRTLRDAAVRLLGPDHIDTLSIRSRLAHAQGESGDAAGWPGRTAAPARRPGARPGTRPWRDPVRTPHPGRIPGPLRRLGRRRDHPGRTPLTDEKRALGPDHPQTLTTRNHLARSRVLAGQPDGVLSEALQVRAGRLRTLGPDHRATMSASAAVGYCQGITGDPTAAVATCAGVLADRQRILGPDHPDVLAARLHLIYWQAEAGVPVTTTLAATDQSFARVSAKQPTVANVITLRSGSFTLSQCRSSPSSACRYPAAFSAGSALGLRPDSGASP